MNSVEKGPNTGGSGPYRFNGIVVDPAAHSLSCEGVEKPVEPKAFAVLLVLLEHPGELVGREDLIDSVWGHQHVTPGVLTRVIAQLRHALGDDPHQPRYIQTRHALGYCFIGKLESADAAVLDQVEGSGEAGPAGMAGVDDGMAAPDTSEPGSHSVNRPQPAPTAWAENWDAEQSSRSWKESAWLWAFAVLAVALAAWTVFKRGPSSPHPLQASVAVMPFVNLSGSHDDDYFAEGLTEEMRNALASVKGLKVAASVTPGIRSTASDAKALGRRLGVATILDASVRREDGRVRISARLSDTSTGFTLWSHTYDRKLSGIFSTQSEIAYRVVQSLRNVIPGEQAALARRLTPTHNAAAFDTYLQGLKLLRSPTGKETVDRAIDRFDEALKTDSGFALAQAGICRAEVWRFEAEHSSDAFFKARAACQRAERMDPQQPQVDLALGDLYRVRSDFPRALTHYRASARSPVVGVKAHVGMAKVYAAQGKQDLAMEQFQKALRLDPHDADVYAQIGYQQYLGGHFRDAIVSYRKLAELKPDDAYTWSTLGGLYMEVGDNAEAARALQQSIQIKPDAATLSNLGLLKYQAGEYAEAVALQRRAVGLDPQDFMYWGNLGEALRADPAAAPEEVGDAFKQAASRVERYLQVKPDDARAVAALGAYRAILGDRKRAMALVRQSETLGGQPGQVALLNAETLGVLGDFEQARKRIAQARSHGIGETLIASNVTFRRLGLLSPAPVSGQEKSNAQHVARGRSSGD